MVDWLVRYWEKTADFRAGLKMGAGALLVVLFVIFLIGGGLPVVAQAPRYDYNAVEVAERFTRLEAQQARMLEQMNWLLGIFGGNLVFSGYRLKKDASKP